jgi:hypothetical protein
MKIEQRGQMWAVMNSGDIVCGYATRQEAEAALEAIQAWRKYHSLLTGR